MLQYYLPGFKAGGPVQSIANMVDNLGGEFNFKIITLDRDAFESEPYPNIKADIWTDIGKAKVYYISPDNLSFGGIKRAITSTSYNVLYLNSFFSPYFSIVPLLLRKLYLIPRCSIVLAPRGEFSPNALKLKRYKKMPFLPLIKSIGLYNNITWQASNELEASYIQNAMGSYLKLKIVPVLIKIASDIPGRANPHHLLRSDNIKKRGHLKIIFLSRISPMKNLDYALTVLSHVNTSIAFDIYGTIEDPRYWEQCQAIINTLPKNVTAKYCGHVNHADVPITFGKYDLFYLPTRGENFGHVISEALLSGLPILISNNTPWQDLEQSGVGWAVSLNDMGKQIEIINRMSEMDQESWRTMSQASIRYARRLGKDDTIINKNMALFKDVLSGT